MSLAPPGHRVAGVVVGHIRGVDHQLQVIQLVPAMALPFPHCDLETLEKQQLATNNIRPSLIPKHLNKVSCILKKSTDVKIELKIQSTHWTIMSPLQMYWRVQQDTLHVVDMVLVFSTQPRLLYGGHRGLHITTG